MLFRLMFRWLLISGTDGLRATKDSFDRTLQRDISKAHQEVPNASYNSRVLAFGRLPTYFWVKPYQGSLKVQILMLA